MSSPRRRRPLGHGGVLGVADEPLRQHAHQTVFCWVSSTGPAGRALPAPPPRGHRLVLTAIRPAILTSQICSLQLIIVSSRISRTTSWCAAYAILMAIFVMGVAFAAEYMGPDRRLISFGRYAALATYPLAVVLVALWARAAARWPEVWAHFDRLEREGPGGHGGLWPGLWPPGVRRLQRLRRRALSFVCISLLFYAPRQAFQVWRAWQTLKSLDLVRIGLLVGGMSASGLFLFNAMLLMVFSDALAECFRAFCAKARCSAQKASDRHIPAEFVEDMRALYHELSQITLAMNNNLGAITLVTLLADGLYIFKFLLLFLKYPEEHPMTLVTNISIAARFFCMLFFASSVHSEWLCTKSCLLRLLPNKGGMAVLRFIIQITTDKVSLTATGVVSFTRPLILALLGAVLSYEIILVQFNSR